MSAREAFVARYPFPLDRFQHDAFDALDRGEHVVVAAPTGSGKTVVAEYGITLAHAEGRRAFYTAPVKALSNQKYRDLAASYGSDTVGLLTGDNSINGDAPVVVMTTEVLRNMIYGRAHQLDDLGVVVLDEVHFLQDSYRGPVWEEVIIHLPHHVRLVCLSATVSNVAQLAEWITTVRGATAAIVESRRPVRLENQYLAADRTQDELRMLPVFKGGGANRAALALDESAVRRRRRTDGPRGRGRGVDRRHGGRHEERGHGRTVLAPPSRVETVELLRERRLLPAIYFIFSRAQCDAAAASCLDAGVSLTTEAERSRIMAIIGEHLGGLDDGDLDVLGYDQFLAQLGAGIAAHHAGMVPPMKEAVEACFTDGLVKVVFATETLAVGINMPARTVVIEKLTKFTGEHHERLTPGEYTQLTGRAGRRGMDDLGTALVLWSPWVRFDEVAELAGSSSFHLRSAFRPTYNMAANLIRTYDSDQAHHLLNLSFAQYQSDRDVVRLEARLERRRAALAELAGKSGSAKRAERIEQEILSLERRVNGAAHSLATEFDRVLDVLSIYGYIDRDRWELTEPGEMLARTFHESDLLVTEILQSGVLVGLEASDVAALVSTVVYEHRSKEPPSAPWFSSSEVRRRWRRIAAISEDLRANERAARLTEHRAPDPGFAAVAYAWVAGEGFAEVVGEEELTGGDFVRTTKQLIDLLRQLAIIAPDRETRRVAADAAERAFRGVVAESSSAGSSAQS